MAAHAPAGVDLLPDPALPDAARVGGAHVAWHLDDIRDPITAHVRSLLGPGEVRTGRLCPRCGSSAHGRPWATHPAAPTLHVSLSRTTPTVTQPVRYAVTALSLDAPLGVDVESVERVAATWSSSSSSSSQVVLAPGEADPGTAEGRARTWAAKEATLKRAGTGLHTPMSQVRLDQVRGLHDLSAPDGFVAVLAG